MYKNIYLTPGKVWNRTLIQCNPVKLNIIPNTSEFCYTKVLKSRKAIFT